jgi:hypothetical protein
LRNGLRVNMVGLCLQTPIATLLLQWKEQRHMAYERLGRPFWWVGMGVNAA